MVSWEAFRREYHTHSSYFSLIFGQDTVNQMLAINAIIIAIIHELPVSMERKSMCFYLLFLPPTPNPLMNASKPTHCNGLVYYLASYKNKHPMERSPWAFISPQIPTLLSMPLSLPTALNGVAYLAVRISGFPAFAENDRIRIWSKSFLIHQSDFLFVLRSV